MNAKNKKTTKTIVLNKGNLNRKKKLSLSNPIYNKDNFKKFCEVETDWNIKSVKKEDLPGELSDETCEFIDLFKRKTANEKTEWNFYIDYEKNEIIHCFQGEATEVKGWINTTLMENRNIFSIHNHIIGSYSAPSAANFEILKHSFENYEIICSEDEYWILEFKGKCPKESYEKIKQKIRKKYLECELENYNENKKKDYDSNQEYSNKLTKYK